MTSAISTTGININYPVAGVDNNSQGFRDNFAQVKTQFDTAASEISSLQSSSASVNSNNAFNQNTLSEFITKQVSEFGYQFSSAYAAGTINADWTLGSYQYATTDTSNGTRTIALTNFGVAGKAARMTVAVDLAATGTNYIKFTAAGTVNIPLAYRVNILRPAGGTGFVPDTITIDPTTGAITAIAVGPQAGTGFSNDTGLVVAGAGGSGATVNITTSAGAITVVAIAGGGTGYLNSIQVALPAGRHMYEFETLDAGVTVNLMNYKFFPL